MWSVAQGPLCFSYLCNKKRLGSRMKLELYFTRFGWPTIRISHLQMILITILTCFLNLTILEKGSGMKLSFKFIEHKFSIKYSQPLTQPLKSPKTHRETWYSIWNLFCESVWSFLNICFYECFVILSIHYDLPALLNSSIPDLTWLSNWNNLVYFLRICRR